MEQDGIDIEKLLEKFSHDLRTPAAAISAGVSGIKRFLPKLIAAYETAKHNNLDVQEIQPIHLKTLAEILENMEGQGRVIERMITDLKNKTARI